MSTLLAGMALSIGVGKALNNTNTRLPGYTGSVHISAPLGKYALDAGYTRIGASQLAENAAIGSLGFLREGSRYTLGISALTGASYSAAVWWDSAHPHVCGVEGCGKRYDNDGTHFSRACHLCGAVVSAEYRITPALGFRLEYYGLRHMTPTFQGVIVQLTYRIH